MPFGPGTYAGEGGAGLAGPALQRQGIPQPMPASAPEGAMGIANPAALSEAMQMLKGGQVGAERFLAVLAALAGQILPQMQAQEQAPQGPAGAGPSIQGLLG